MTAIGPAWTLSKKSKTLRISLAEAARHGRSGIISTKLRSDFVQSESRQTRALSWCAQRRHRDRLRCHSSADGRAFQEHRILLARTVFQSNASRRGQAQRERLPGRRAEQNDYCEIFSRRFSSIPRSASQ